MVANFINIDSSKFSLNGIELNKSFVALDLGNGTIRIVSSYDSKFVLLQKTSVHDISIDGVTYPTAADLIKNLNNVIYSRVTLTSSEIQELKNSVQDVNNTVQSISAGEGGILYNTLAEAQALDPKPQNGTIFQVSEITDPNNAGLYSFQSAGPNGTRFEKESFISGDYIDKINLVNNKNFQRGYYNEINDYIDSNNWASFELNINPSTQYTLSGYAQIGNTSIPRLLVLDSNENILETILSGGVGFFEPVTFTTSTTAQKIRINIGNVIDIGLDPIGGIYRDTLQLQIGDIASDFVPFEGQIKEKAIPNSFKNTPTGNFIQKESDTKIWFHIKLHNATYLRLLMIRLSSDTDFFDIWGLRTSYIAILKNGAFTLSTPVIKSGVWELALSVSGFPDNFLGSSHSCEKIIDYSILINGKFIDVLSLPIGEFIESEEITFLQRSKLLPANGNGYDNNNLDSNNAIAEVRRKWLFKGNEIYLDQFLNWVNDLSIGDSAYTTMLPIYRLNTGGIQITTKALRNDEYQLYDVTNQGFVNNLNNRVNDSTNILIAGDILSAEVEMLEMTPRNDNAGMWVQNTLDYNKIYSQIGAINVTSGDKWVMKSVYRFNHKKSDS